MKDYRIIETGRGAVNHLVRAHYLHRWPGVVTAILALMEGPEPIGVLVFALPPRETAKRYGVDTVWELARLFILDRTPKNTETWFVSRAIRWIRRNHPQVGALVSYADPSAGHEGIIYKAGNWIADSRTDAGRKARVDYISDGGDTLFGPEENKKHSRRSHVPSGVHVSVRERVSKFRFIYWLDGRHEQRRKKAQNTNAD